MAEFDPVLSRIDEMMSANIEAVYAGDRVLKLPPSCLRIVTPELERSVITRRNPAQVPVKDYYDRRAQAEYDICQDAQIDVPLSLYGIPNATKVSTVFHSSDNPGWRLYASSIGDTVHGPRTPESEALPRGVKVSPKQQESLMAMLRTARVIDISKTSDRKLWQASRVQSLEAVLNVLGYGDFRSLLGSDFDADESDI